MTKHLTKLELIQQEEKRVDIAPFLTSEILKEAELAVRLKLCVRTIRNMTKRRVIPRIKIGRSVRYHWGSVLKALLMK